MTDNSRISVTLKGNGGYDQPWVVVKGNEWAEVNDLLLGYEASGVAATVGRVHAYHQSAVNVGAALGATPVSPPASAPRPLQTPTDTGPPPGAGSTPSCAHGQRVWKQSKPGAAKSWAAYMCPLPQARKDEQCAPEWVN